MFVLSVENKLVKRGFKGFNEVKILICLSIKKSFNSIKNRIEFYHEKIY